MELNKYEIPAGLAIAGSMLYPQAVGNVIGNVVGGVQAILGKTASAISTLSPKLGAAAPLAMPLLAGLGGGKLAQIGLDKLGIENQLFRLAGIGTGVYFAASSVVAPYFASGAGIYYAGKYGWRFSKGALSKVKSGVSFLNPFKKIGTS